MIKKNRTYKQLGFTLIELLVVITIISILMSIGVVSYRQAGMNARNGKRKTDLEIVRQALVLYRSDNSSYPTGVTGFDDLVDSYLRPNYLSADGVIDPKQEAPYLYSYSSDDGRTFTITACLEPSSDPCKVGQIHEVRNP
ncbi:MAG: prepilin-type N-terminal cleavage/methylation domain-containing protein [Patescibacteria group bacterium]